MLRITEDARGVTFAVRIVPRASRNEIVGEFDGALRIRIAAVPVEGAANRELVKFLANQFKVRQSDVELISGASSKTKLVRLTEITAAAIDQLRSY